MMSLPLENCLVLDLTRALAGPFCTMILGDLGANVIKVEPTPDGEMSRMWGPFVGGESIYFLSTNRNKRSIAVNFRRPEGLALLRTIAGKVDILVENFKPGVAQEMGLGYEDLAPANDRLVYASITGFGHGGPYENWPGFDQIAQGMSGLMSLTGTPESGRLRVGIPIGDLTAGMWMAIGILSAVVQRHTTGLGQRVETSLLAGLIGLLGVLGQRYLTMGHLPELPGNDHPVIWPYGAFETSNGPLNIAAATESMWRTLCLELGLEELADHPDYLDNVSRVSHREALRQLLNERLRGATKEEWARRFISAGIPAGPIWGLDEVFNDAHVLKSGCLESLNHPTLGAVKQIANPIQLDERPAIGRRLAPPLLGEHTEIVLQELGFGNDQIAALLRDCIVQRCDAS